MKTLRLGTRRSPLAKTQSQMVATLIEQKNPDCKVELVGIETQGDRILDVPLSQIEGKEFFVKELDTALINGEVDLSVHSLKDLSTERPSGIQLAAIPAREDPRDVLIFNHHALDRLLSGEPLLIGTSSPRRLHNLSDFLKVGLPRNSSSSASFKFVEIRGNVHTRLSRIHEPMGQPKYLDGVVLALAGLSRLADFGGTKDSILGLLTNVRWMIPPLSQNPSSPGQGALAVECREDDDEAFKLIRSIHDDVASNHISQERELMAEWGGGCHQRFGITVVDVPRLGSVMFKKGVRSNGTEVDGMSWDKPDQKIFGVNDRVKWDGMKHKPKRVELEGNNSINNAALFIAHTNASNHIDSSILNKSRVWCSGKSSWEKLAQRGVWVEGCADGFGFDFIRPLLAKNILSLPKLKEWGVFTHLKASDDWEECDVIPQYDVTYLITDEDKEQLGQAGVVFWSSGYQFDTYSKFVSNQAIHCCGSGKTAQHLSENLKQDFYPFPSYESWVEFISKKG